MAEILIYLRKQSNPEANYPKFSFKRPIIVIYHIKSLLALTKIVLWVEKKQKKLTNKINDTFQPILDHLIIEGARPKFPFKLFQCKLETVVIAISSYSYWQSVTS